MGPPPLPVVFLLRLSRARKKRWYQRRDAVTDPTVGAGRGRAREGEGRGVEGGGLPIGCDSCQSCVQLPSQDP